MVESNPTINPVTGRQWDVNSLIEKLLELQDTLLQSQERNIMLTAQARELERIARDAEDLKGEIANQGQLLDDKSRENKYIHQELSRMASVLDAKVQEVEDLKAIINDLQHQLKTCQQERDLLAVMLTEAEAKAKGQGRGQGADSNTDQQAGGEQGGWLPFLKGKR